jgi:hypothetical protein
MKNIALKLKFTFILFSLFMIIQSCQKNEIKGKKNIDVKVNSTNWPKNLDALISAPNNHKILLENDKVRVLEVTVLPKEIEPIHHHKWPSVMHIQSIGEFIDRDGKGNVIIDSREMKEKRVLPFTMWKEVQEAHYVENLSDSITIKLIRVEYKQ